MNKRFITLILVTAILAQCSEGFAAHKKSKRWGNTKPPPGSTINWGDPINNGLVGAWIFNDAGGTLAKDIASRNDGIQFGGELSSVGIFGKSRTFNGSSDYVDIGNPSQLQLLKSITICAWFRTTSSANNTILSKFNPTSSQRAYKLRINGGTVDVVISTDGSTNAFTLTDTVATNDGRWHFAVMTNDGTGDSNSAVLYVDGRRVRTTGTSSIFNSTASTQIGRQDTGSNPTLFTGRLDNIRVYRRAILQSEAMRLYREPFAGITTPKIRLVRSVAAVPSTPSDFFGIINNPITFGGF